MVEFIQYLSIDLCSLIQFSEIKYCPVASSDLLIHIRPFSVEAVRYHELDTKEKNFYFHFAAWPKCTTS